MVLRLQICKWVVDCPKMTWKIEKHSDGPKTTIRLIGRMQVGHLADLQRLINEGKSPIVLDLGELILVDLAAVRFLGRCLNDGVSLLHCPQYIGRWIAKEQDTNERLRGRRRG